MNDIIIRPIITEKSMAQANLGKFTFAIRKSANKSDVKRAVEKSFNVTVKSVTTMTLKGKTKRVGMRRAEIDISSTKKAVVLLAKGQKIGMFELSGE